jgi:hypothetical protein
MENLRNEVEVVWEEEGIMPALGKNARGRRALVLPELD